MKHIQIEIRYEDQVWINGLDYNESKITIEEIIEQTQIDWTDAFAGDIENFDNDKYSINYFVLDLEESN